MKPAIVFFFISACIMVYSTEARWTTTARTITPELEIPDYPEVKSNNKHSWFTKPLCPPGLLPVRFVIDFQESWRCSSKTR